MTEPTSGRPPIAWPTTLFIAGTTLVTIAYPLYAWAYGVTSGEIILALFYFIACGLSITAGYHRLVAHRAYKCHPALELFFLLFGAAAWQGSALEWGADHVQHHAYTDTNRDPYDISRGFWYAHVGWLFRKTSPSAVPSFLKTDQLIVWQHRYYVAIAVMVSFVVPFLIAGTGGLLLAGVVRTFAGHHVTWFINSWAHVGTKRPYNPTISASDNWFLAFFTFGEGYHNYHHAFPTDYRNGIRALSFDPSKWLIWSLSLLGVTWDLKRIGAVRQWRQRVRAAIEQAGAGVEGSVRLRQTRAALEKQILRSRTNLARALERAGERMDSLHHHAALEELTQRWDAAVRDARAAVGRASARRVQRVSELAERLKAYQALLEQLVAHEQSLAGACA